MAKKPGRKPGNKIYDAYLPQTAATQHMVDLARSHANEKYQGSIGALVRDAVRRLLADAYTPGADVSQWKDEE